jgi:hypothetical protein
MADAADDWVDAEAGHEERGGGRMLRKGVPVSACAGNRQVI